MRAHGSPRWASKDKRQRRRQAARACECAHVSTPVPWGVTCADSALPQAVSKLAAAGFPPREPREGGGLPYNPVAGTLLPRSCVLKTHGPLSPRQDPRQNTPSRDTEGHSGGRRGAAGGGAGAQGSRGARGPGTQALWPSRTMPGPPRPPRTPVKTAPLSAVVC